MSWTGQTSTGEKETGAAEETVERSVWVGVGLNGGGLKKQWLKKKWRKLIKKYLWEAKLWLTDWNWLTVWFCFAWLCFGLYWTKGLWLVVIEMLVDVVMVVCSDKWTALIYWVRFLLREFQLGDNWNNSSLVEFVVVLVVMLAEKFYKVVFVWSSASPRASLLIGVHVEYSVLKKQTFWTVAVHFMAVERSGWGVEEDDLRLFAVYDADGSFRCGKW